MLRRTQYVSACAFAKGRFKPFVTSSTTCLISFVHSQQLARSRRFQAATSSHEVNVEQATRSRDSSADGRSSSLLSWRKLSPPQRYRRKPPRSLTFGSSLPPTIAWRNVLLTGSWT